MTAAQLKPGAGAAPPATDAAPRYELSPDLVTLSEVRREEAEAIRTVRTHIIARHLEDGRRGLAVCAASPDVGCTFTAVNLAVSLAQVGISTLLIDGDLRSPQLENFIKPQTPTEGVRQYLSEGDRPLSNVIHPEVLPNLSLLFAGGEAKGAQELLAGDAFRRLIDRCLRDFEFTIIDTPPVSRCADALRIAKTVGYTLIVARANTSRTSDVANLAHQLHEDGAKVIGTILNDL